MLFPPILPLSQEMVSDAEPFLRLLAAEHSSLMTKEILEIAAVFWGGNPFNLMPEEVEEHWNKLERWANLSNITATQAIVAFASGLREELGSESPETLPQVFSQYFQKQKGN